MAEPEIPAELRLQSSAQWKALSHPLRLGILRLLIDAELTNEELADRLGVASGKLYFHTKRLRDAGLIVPAGTRQKGPLTEKLYRAAARRFLAPEPVKGGDSPPLEAAIWAGLELYRSTWQATNGLAGQLEYGFHMVLPQAPERRRELVTRLQALLADFRDPAASEIPGGTAPIAFTVLLHAVPPSDLTTE